MHDDEAPRPPELRFLKWLTGTLAAVMIAGLIAIVALLALRLPQPAPPLALPEGLVLPEGARAEAVTFGRDFIAVVTEADEILIYDRVTGALRQTVRLEGGAAR